MLRVSGKRTLSKFNAFDLIVTIALGSTLATVLLTKDVALVEGLLAFTLLISLQWGVAWLSIRSQRWCDLVKSEPRLLVYRGQFLDAAMRAERITANEVRSAIRSAGTASLADVEAVVLETDGSVSVVTKSSGRARDALEDVCGLNAES